MRIHSTTTGLDAGRLEPGRDLALGIDEQHGLTLPAGVLSQDYLDLGARREVDRVSVAAIARWRERYDDALTLDGVPLPTIWETDLLLRVAVPAVRDALALRSAVETHRPRSIEPADDSPWTARLVHAVAPALDVSIREGRRRTLLEPPTRRISEQRLVRARKTAVVALKRAGVPSALRPGSVVVYGYWSLNPLIDRMLEAGVLRPALTFLSPPPGPARSLRMALRGGGWLGVPRRRARADATGPLRRAVFGLNDSFTLEPFGLPLGRLVHDSALDLVTERGPRDLATALLVRRDLSRAGRVAKVVVPTDLAADARLLTLMAQQAGVPTLGVSHGAAFFQTAVTELQLPDEVAVWSSHSIPLAGRPRPLHVVGYPVPDGPLPCRRSRRKRSLRVLVLGQGSEPSTSLIDGRMALRQYACALAAVARVSPEAMVTLRPHPFHESPPLAALETGFGGSMRVDRDADILDLLDASDVCIGSMSTATLQAGLRGTPAVVLNLTGFEWGWPLGGDTPVPIARSEEDLVEHLRQLGEDDAATSAAREALLAALGAGVNDPAGSLLAAVEAATAHGGPVAGTGSAPAPVGSGAGHPPPP